MSDKKLSQYLRLKDKHPTMVKLAKLANYAEKLGISLSFGHYHAYVEDRDRDKSLPPLIMKDLEDGEMGAEWPPIFEYKVVFENPEYIAQQKAEQEERDKKRAAEEVERKAKREAEEKAARAAIAAELEKRERAELVRLKAKYND